MVNNRTKIGIVLILAMLMLAVTASAVSARRGSPWVGRWQTMDPPIPLGDGSTNTLNISYRGRGPDYQLIWRETYFSLCGGRPGIGRGTAYEDQAGLHASISFYCTGKFALEVDFLFTHNTNDTITSLAIYQPNPLEQDWDRIPPPQR